MVNFWAKIKSGTQNKLSYMLLSTLASIQNNTDIPCEFTWLKHIQDSLNSMGFSEAWSSDIYDWYSFKCSFKQRCSDIFKQDWHDQVLHNSQCSVYKVFKNHHEFETYLINLDPAHRYSIVKFRTRNHHLPVTKGRFQKDNQENQNCPLCDKEEIGD